MDIRHSGSPLSIRLPEEVLNHERRWPSSRSDSQSSLSSSSSSRAPMTIPQSRPAEAPPPLPPPRFIEGLANGDDQGWRWGNPGFAEGSGKLAPIKQSSSLFGGYRQPLMDINGDGDPGDEMDVDGEFDRRPSTVSTVRAPSQPEVMPGALGYIQSSSDRTPSPTAVSTQRLAHSSFVIFGPSIACCAALSRTSTPETFYYLLCPLKWQGATQPL